MNDLKSLLRAASFAAQKHTGHKRKGSDGQPYINHPLEVASLLANVGGVTDFDVLIGALLHDTVEDTGVTREELKALFGDTAAGYVSEVTDDKSLPKAERKRLQVEHAPGLSHGAKLIKLGDKISNIIDVTNNPPEGWDLRRRIEYVDWGVAVVNGLRGTNAGLEALFDETVRVARMELA
jgi:guanosine-3',5'-bis(diphosphate) 3'-pyrophosphohydrolase